MSLLLRHLLLSLLLALLQNLGRRRCCQPGNLQFRVLVHFRVRGRVGHTSRVLDLLAVGECHVFRDMCRHGSHHGLRSRALAHDLLDLWVLNSRHVHGNVGVVVLVDERLDRLAVDNVHVFRHGVCRLEVVVDGDELLCVAHAQHVQHLPVQVRQVVELWSPLGHLHDGLVLHDLLRHCGGVRVAYRDDINRVVVVLLGATRAVLGVVLVVVRSVVPDDVLEQPELLTHRIVDARLHSGHHLQRTFEDGEGGPYRRLRRHITDLEVSSAGEPTPLVHNSAQQGVEDLARLLVRERHDVVAHGPAGHVHVAPLTRTDGGVVPLDPEPLGLEATRQVRQGTCVDQLTDKRRAGLGEGTDQVDEAEGIEAKARDVGVVDEVVALGLVLVVRVPVAADSQNGRRALLDSDHVRQADACGLAVVLVLVTLKVQVDVHLQQLVAVVR